MTRRFTIIVTLFVVMEMYWAPGCKTDSPPSKPTVPLHKAVLLGSLEEVEAHVRSGKMDVEYRNEFGGSLLHIAGVGCRRWGIHEDPPCSSYIAIVKILLDNGAAVNARDNYGRTLLHYLAGNCDAKIPGEYFSLLISRGADVNAVDNLGWTPLHLAVSASRHCLENVKSLVEFGADLNVAPSPPTSAGDTRSANMDRSTPLDTAIKKDHVDIIRYLHGKGAKTTRTYSATIETAGSPLINGKSWRDAADITHEPVGGLKGKIYQRGKAIEDLVLSKMSELQECISEAYSKCPRKMRGKLSVRFDIESGGSVRKARGYSHWNYRELEWCVAKKIRNMRFPYSFESGIMMVEYPFILKSLGADGKPGGSGDDMDVVLEGVAPKRRHTGTEAQTDEEERAALSEVLSQPDLGQRILSNGELLYHVRFKYMFLVRTDSPARTLKSGTSRGTLYKQEFVIEEVFRGEPTYKKIDAKFYLASDKAPPEKKTFIIVVSTRLGDFNVIAFVEPREETLSKLRELIEGKWRREREEDARFKGGAHNRIIRYGMATSRPRVYMKIGNITINGSMSKKVVSSVVQYYSDRNKYWCAKEFANDPGIRGTVVIEFTVSTRGFVTHVEVKGSTLENEEIGKCMAGRIPIWKFPESPQGTTEIRVEYRTEIEVQK